MGGQSSEPGIWKCFGGQMVLGEQKLEGKGNIVNPTSCWDSKRPHSKKSALS